jgi:hypothetical protein
MNERQKERLILMGIEPACDDSANAGEVQCIKVVHVFSDNSYNREPNPRAIGAAKDRVAWASILSRAAETYAAKLQEQAKQISRRSESQRTYLNAIIGGRVSPFASIEEKFQALVSECASLRRQGSSIDIFANDAYGQIAALGPPVVPLLLNEMQKQSGHWATALTWITGHDPVTKDILGNLRAIREAWIRWGIEHGHIKSNLQGKVVHREFEGDIRKRLQPQK